jgi:hypothetical protein
MEEPLSYEGTCPYFDLTSSKCCMMARLAGRGVRARMAAFNLRCATKGASY